ncbi:peptidase C45 acyl-coenzyme A:6-aminopenicillanic acid acyl-transferas-like protein [Teratosphaeria nubilosa]|uniref:Peptidase C45 acyl-coenzyme A:6-aminopenicillanic acid acyl-transferas-like protein n=1 Tax=Teratosphaeria nubilosa TaxID=161662 RepID=A0A6G1KYP1_9PEZI|nr:peptidase C45 acyl-coenzyme A:6-aminopenicillanic acid acyl-transferas-like protein [Teratosphaeria nubilosa]
MLQIKASGTPYQIGLKHGQEARSQVRGTMEFYAGLFKVNAKMDWRQVQEIALSFEPVMRRKWPEYLDEMRGIALGAGVDLAGIVALNVRTEINFGLFSDGCTALSWRTERSSFLAQNWDWMEEQKRNLVIMTIEQRDKPTIKMVTEAGIIGKIGLNSAGVGVCLNAIKVKGMDPTRIPCHLGLRLVLESESREDAVSQLEKYGVASSCHMLVADAAGAIGLEWSSVEVQKITANASSQIFHSNHYLAKHPGLEDTNWLKDSYFRVQRIEELSRTFPEEPTMEDLFDRIFKDECNYPGAICRAQTTETGSATLFNIIMDLSTKQARVSIGRPVAPEQVIDLAF